MNSRSPDTDNTKCTSNVANLSPVGTKERLRRMRSLYISPYLHCTLPAYTDTYKTRSDDIVSIELPIDDSHKLPPNDAVMTHPDYSLHNGLITVNAHR